MSEQEEEEELRRRLMIRSAAESRTLTADQRTYLRQIESWVDLGMELSSCDRWRVRRLVGRVAIGP